jgi:hypothetical protein
MASHQQNVSLSEDFETEHDRAWDYADSGNYAQAEAMFKQLGNAGYARAWVGLGFVLRDNNPMERGSSEYSDAAVNALESVGNEPEDNELETLDRLDF